MANQWFRFKHFTLQQDKCAMKVGTDGVILGAWMDVNNAKTALDIGTGTGLLALMLAQRSPALQIDAIEIDADAATQAMENVAESQFHKQISIWNVDFNEYSKHCNYKYDLIISNPPFFRDSLKPDSMGRAMARHTETLTLGQLLSGVKKLLSPQGKLSIILPFELVMSLIDMAAIHNLFPGRILKVIPVPGKDAKRGCIEFSFKKKEVVEDSLVIEVGGRHHYSEEYKKLTQDFYLDM